jgi:hypothetical protein
MEDWKEWRQIHPEPFGNQIPTDRAWRMFADWQTHAREIGVLFVSQSGTFLTLATLTNARNGTIQLKGEFASASFNLREAKFMYGPMHTWPRWPNPPIVEVMALHALLPRGSWLCMAQDLKPDALTPRMLPQ